jgi:predicted nuclease with TOPRIM domain
MLTLQERLARSEQIQEQLRLELHKKQSEYKTVVDKLNEVKFEKAKLEADIANEETKLQYQQLQLRDQEDLLSQNKKLSDELLASKAKLNDSTK